MYVIFYLFLLISETMQMITVVVMYDTGNNLTVKWIITHFKQRSYVRNKVLDTDALGLPDQFLFTFLEKFYHSC